MIGTWKKEICATQPDELQVIAPDLFKLSTIVLIYNTPSSINCIV